MQFPEVKESIRIVLSLYFENIRARTSDHLNDRSCCSSLNKMALMSLLLLERFV